MKRIIGVISMIAGGILYVVAREISMVPYPLYIIGAVIIIIGFRLIINSKPVFEKKEEKAYRAAIANLKQTGKKINITFDTCEIVSNKYFEEIPKSNLLGDPVLDALYDNRNNVSITEQNCSRIIYTDFETGKTFVSQLVFKEKTTLSLLLYSQGNTTIYTNNDSYYFDLEFLND